MNNFDEIVDRSGTHTMKYERRKSYFGTTDVIPMWVADMEFRVPETVAKVIRERAEHDVFGYTVRPDSFIESIVGWQKKRYGWDINQGWVRFSPGTVPALNMLVLALTEPGDGIILQTPVYYPLYNCIEYNKRRLLENPLLLENGRYRMDYDGLRLHAAQGAKMLMLCSPHNPGGNVWTKEELMQVAEICLENNITIVSDEIHSDLVFSGHRHIPVASLNKEISDLTVTCMAPSKTFNIAGLSTSYVVSSNTGFLNKYSEVVEQIHLNMGNIFGNIAIEAAYNTGESWLEELLVYLERNRDYIVESFEGTSINVIKPEGTFLAWFDCREMGKNDDELKKFFIEEAKVGLSHGLTFGKGGSGFQRINFGCAKPVLEEAVGRIKKVL